MTDLDRRGLSARAAGRPTRVRAKTLVPQLGRKHEKTWRKSSRVNEASEALDMSHSTSFLAPAKRPPRISAHFGRFLAGSSAGMASCTVLMRRRRSQRPRQPTCEERLAAQVAELEQRIKLLEARVRSAVAEGALGARTGAMGKARSARPVRVRPRPRCPGCLLELPPGRPLGENCVWCGFSFAAVPARP